MYIVYNCNLFSTDERDIATTLLKEIMEKVCEEEQGKKEGWFSIQFDKEMMYAWRCMSS